MAWAQTAFTATYTFTGTTGHVEKFSYNGTLYDGISMGTIDKVGVTSSSSTGNFRATGWPLGAISGSDTFTGSVDTGKYFGFTITAASGYKFTVSTITFGIGRSATGTRQCQWRGSYDNYGSILDNYTTLNTNLNNSSGVLTNPDTNSSWTGNIITLGSDYANITTNCGFRLYLYNSEATGGTAGLQGPITITGTFELSGGNPTVATPNISPSTNTFYSAFNATISCTTEGATIYYTTDGSDPDETATEYTEPIYIEDTTTLKAIAYAEGYDPSAIATAVYTFPEITEVADIATLRNQPVGSNVYRLTGEAILTFQQSLSYHPKWIQDATAAIYIYDTAGKITTAYNMGDGITGLLGTLSTYNSLLEFVPVADPGPASSTGNVIIPEERTLASLTSADQSKLIKVYNVTLGSTGNFSSGTQSIPVTQGETTLTLRTLTSTDYNGEPIPQTPQNITCLVGQYNADIQITPRFLADFEEAFDFLEDTPTPINGLTVTISGGNANVGSGPIPPIPNQNVNFTPLSFVLDNSIANWTITIQPGAAYGAYYQNGSWHTVTGTTEQIIFNITFAKGKGSEEIPIVLGEQDPTLPVELSSFTAVLTSDMYVLIKWIAESETNHSGYNILRAEKKDLATAQRINAQIIDEGVEAGTQISYSYTDFEAYTNMVYYYWLESVSLDGVSSYYGPSIVTIGDPNQEPRPPEVLMATKLLNAYPNPFNPNTNIRYSLKDAGKVRIDIYNMKGQVIQTLTAEHNIPGFYQLAWDGCDANGKPVASGIYMYRMTSGNYSSAKKMVLAK
ncbi:MAG TPA: FN3 associated domain-containing protein [Candidatus Cloacimonas sp.]|nr:FN3 associated domain-containing protein [Candidatus Cloacimonas sp.]